MKKFLSLTIVSLTFLGLGSLTSCQDEDLGVSTQTLKERAFDDAFIKQFGKPDANQSWDFYAQAMESVKNTSGAATRIAGSGAGWSVTVRGRQPDYITQTGAAAQYSNLLPERQNNYTMGQTQYSLVATGDGKFTISAILYAGVLELISNAGNYNFHIRLCFYDRNNVLVRHSIFEGRSINHTPTEGDFVNPGLSVDVQLDPGTEFWFELDVTRAGNDYRYPSTDPIDRDYSTVNWPEGSRVATGVAHDYYHNYNGPSQLLYSETQYPDPSSGSNTIMRYMVIGFEDAWDWLDYLDFDYNDVVLYIDGDIPVPQAKRFFAEDLEAYDWDYNDVVFDVEYQRVVLRAVGGTLPVYLGFYNRETRQWQVSRELHEVMAQGQQPRKDAAEKVPGTDWYKPINVGANNGVDGYIPAIALTWDHPLTEAELLAIGTQKVTVDGKERSDIELLVGTGTDQAEIEEVDKHTSITYAADNSKCPAIIMATVSTRWLKERQIITSAYPTFYDGRTPASGTQTIDDYWFAVDVISGNLYEP